MFVTVFAIPQGLVRKAQRNFYLTSASGGEPTQTTINPIRVVPLYTTPEKTATEPSYGGASLSQARLETFSGVQAPRGTLKFNTGDSERFAFYLNYEILDPKKFLFFAFNFSFFT